MASVFYIETVPPQGEEPEFFELSLTTDFTLNYRSRVTQNPVESGVSIADHVVNQPVGVTYSGFVNNVKNLSLEYQKNLSETIEGLLNIRSSKNTFILHFDNNLDAIPNSVFTELSFSKASGFGDTYSVDVSTQQIIVGEAATEVTISDQDPSVAKQHATQSSNSDNNTERTNEDEVKKTLLLSGALSSDDVANEAFGG